MSAGGDWELLVPTQEHPPFGRYLVMPEAMKAASAMVVSHSYMGLRPRRILLPGQLYVATIDAIEEPWDAIDVHPLYGGWQENWFKVARRG